MLKNKRLNKHNKKIYQIIIIIVIIIVMSNTAADIPTTKIDYTVYTPMGTPVTVWGLFS